MKLEFMCKCGLYNWSKKDWLAHWKHGVVKSSTFPSKNYPKPIRKILNKYPKLRAIYFFLMTEIRIAK